MRRLALFIIAVTLVVGILTGCRSPNSMTEEVIATSGPEASDMGKARTEDESVASRAESIWPDISSQPQAETEHASTPLREPETDQQRGADENPISTRGREKPQDMAKTVVLDPGHSGDEVGAVFSRDGRTPVVEKHVNLALALRLASLLEQAGYRVVLTRDADGPANSPPVDRTGDGRITLRDDLQARVDIANGARADLFISLHNNGSNSPVESGTEVWYSKDRPFRDKNYLLARELQSAILRRLLGVGYRSRDRGVKDDTYFRIWRGQPFNIFVLGPAREPSHPRATEMPGALVESLFVSNEVEAGLLQQDEILDAIAAGYFEGISRYFALVSD